ncbi:hypothetical protein PWE26_25070, partial [Enterobacter hormaechei subsp. xiangfangensis]|nr:hypothetical protein [Enterobacter hormaechei subsp. xiangfangensis]
MKKILLLHMLVFVSATLPISSVASDEVETLKCTIIADAITGNTLYETGECARRVSPCSSFKGVLGIFRPKTTKCSGGRAVRGLQRG